MCVFDVVDASICVVGWSVWCSVLKLTNQIGGVEACNSQRCGCVVAGLKEKNKIV